MAQSRHFPAVFLTALAAALLFTFEPATTWWLPSCPLYALTGWLCPLCGSLRAVHALLHGAPRVAFGLNPMTTLVLAAALVAFGRDMLHPGRATRQTDRIVALCFSPRAMALAVVFGIGRNVPWGAQ